MLREQFGIEDPERLYLSDTLPTATVVYDTDWDRGRIHRRLPWVGRCRCAAPAKAGEREHRLADTSPLDFPVSTHKADASLASLDSVVRPLMESLLVAARRAGFNVGK